jgi:hypothetical protein
MKMIDTGGGTLMPKKILFICKKHSLYGYTGHDFGIVSGLRNSASFVVNYLNTQGYDADIVTAIDGNCVDRLITEFNPDVVVIEAIWVTPDKLHELMSIHRHKRRLWIIIIHSKFPFLAHEGMAFYYLLGYRRLTVKFKNLVVAPNSQEATDDLEETFGLRTTYLPNIYQPPDVQCVEQKEKDFNTIDIGCFGAVRPMKNQLTQAIAAVKFANEKDLRLRFHVNAGRTEQQGENVLKNLRAFFEGQELHTLVEHKWLDYEDFICLVREMDMGMQVSLSETFNIVAADFVSSNIPLIGSKEIDWLPNMFVADPSSTDDIARVLDFAWTLPGYWLRKMSKIQLGIHNTSARKHWIKFLEHCRT